MSVRKVETKEELKKAKEDKVDEIIVVGKLAKDLMDAKKVTKMGKVPLATLTAAIAIGAAAAPFTGGTSLGISAAAAAPIAVATGVSIPVIILISFLGIGLVMAIFKDYEEIEFDGKELRLKLKK